METKPPARTGHDDDAAAVHHLLAGVADYAVCSLDTVGLVASWNRGAALLKGYGREVLGTSYERFFSPEDRAAGRPVELLRRAADDGHVVDEGWRVRADGRRMWVRATLTAVRGETGDLLGFTEVTADRTGQHTAEEELRAKDSMLESLLRSSPSAILAVDEDGLIRWVNRRCDEMFGHAPGALVGSLVEVLVPPLMARRHVDLRRAFAAAPATRQTGTGLDLTARRADGTEFPVEIGLGASHDAAGDRLVTVVVTDVSERAAAQRRIVHESTHDPLTGLANRVLLLDRTEQALHRPVRPGADAGQLAVVVLDIDRFSRVNDSVGHPGGDQVLVDVAARVTALLRAGDSVARIGGDRFAVLSEGLQDATDAVVVAEHLMTVFVDPVPTAAGPVLVSARAGVAVARQGDGQASSLLLQDAETALRRVRRLRRSLVEVFDPTLRAEVDRRLTIEAGLRQALADDHLELHVQPIVELATGRVTAAEALLRWRRPGHTALELPGRFLDVAEGAGMMADIDGWVLRTGAALAARWQERLGARVPVLSVNVSTSTLGGTGYAALVDTVLDAHQLEAGCLQLEVLEDAFVDDEGIASALRLVRARGVGVAVDDFGTGHSSLARLQLLPVTTLKIDRSLVVGVGDGGAGDALVTAVLELARAHGLRAVAEGVEHEAQRDALVRLGCSHGQGYWLGRPMPVDALEPILDRETVA